MTRIGIIGAGSAAALHADAVLRLPDAELIGIAASDTRRSELSVQAGVPVLPVADLCQHSDVLIVAVPPNAVPSVLDTIANTLHPTGSVRAVLVEPPFGEVPALPVPTVAAANLLHAPVVRTALGAIARLDQPHHLQLTVQQPTPRWVRNHATVPVNPLLDPGIRFATLLLAAAGEPALGAETTVEETKAKVVMTLASHRQVILDVEWTEGSAIATLEAADATGVVRVTFDPLPALELNGEPTDVPALAPIEALGFVAQVRRLIAVSNGASPWPPIDGVLAIEQLLRHPTQ